MNVWAQTDPRIWVASVILVHLNGKSLVSFHRDDKQPILLDFSILSRLKHSYLYGLLNTKF